VCGSALLVVVAAHTVTLDMGVTAFLAAALAGFLVAQFGNTSPTSRRGWLLATWIAMALAILSKGLIGVVIPGAALVAYIAWQRDPGLLRRLYIVSGLALLLAIAAPWFILLARRDPTFLPFFFIHEHFGRFLSKVVDRNHPWWYYLPILIVGLLPWTTFVPAAIGKGWRAARDGDRAMRLVLAWSVLVLVFFSVSGAKLPLYVLPLFPALALLIAAAIVELSPRAVAWRLLPIAVLGLAGAAALAWLPHTSILHGTRAMYVPLCAPMAWALLALSAGTGIGTGLAVRDRVDTAIAAAALGGLLFAQGLLFGYQRLAPATSAKAMAALAQPHLQPGVPVYAVRMFYRGLPFYLQRPVTLVDQRPYDMRAGMALDPGLSLPDLAHFGPEWVRHPGALAFMSRETYSTLSGQHLPMQPVATVAGTVIVRNPAPASAPAPRRF
jgi:4-amino-4-deoxy-L-arabinose transferase-like glycosyltransferase